MVDESLRTISSQARAKGLALVQQLASAMQAEVDVVNADPGAEFRLRFPAD